MKFIVATLAGLATLAQAIKISNSAIDPVAGEKWELTWIEADGPVTIELVYGNPGALQPDSVIATDLDPDSGSFTWDVPTDLVPRTDYAFTIKDSSGQNWSEPFSLEGTGVEATSSAAPTTTAASSTEVTSAATTTGESSTLSTVTTESETSSAEPTETGSETESSSTSTPAQTTAPPDSKAGRLGSPVALILTLAAMLYFH